MPPPICQCSEFKVCSVVVKSHHITGIPVGSLLAPTLNPILESASERLPIHAYSGALDQTNAERQRVTPKLQYLEWFGVLTASHTHCLWHRTLGLSSWVYPAFSIGNFNWAMGVFWRS